MSVPGNPIRRKSRLVAVFLAVFVLFACFAPAGPAALRAQATAGFERGADPDTSSSWTEYFGDGTPNTANAGRIWTDKTVLDGDAGLAGSNVPVPRQDADNFLVGLSALSSFKNIVGSSLVPIDVMLVLDISSSMRTTANRGAITSMVAATNETIASLMNMNPANRVGVVLFDEYAYDLLPMDTYTSNTVNGIYLYVEDNTGEADITANATGPVAGSRTNTISATSGTFTQGGLSVACQQFLGNTPGGRLPILVLMSDGSPTIGTTGYTDNLQDGSASGLPGAMRSGSGTTGLAFVTQLTAAYTKAQIEGHYGQACPFYTLGFGLESLSGNTGVLARTVLDPTQSTEDLDAYWTQFNGLPVSQTMQVVNKSTPYTLQKANADLDQFKSPAYATAQYVESYFTAADQAALQGGFQEILEEIVLQTRTYPTQTGDNADMSGYLHFEDDVGEHMEVKRMSGLVYEGTLYTGATFSQTLQLAYDQYLSGNDGDTDNPGGDPGGDDGDGSGGTVYTNHVYEFVKSSAQRLGIPISQALELMIASYNDGQLYYNSDQDFGNSFLWYGDDADNYIAPAPASNAAANAPAGATIINRSYVYFREINFGKVGPDLMYIGARVKTSLSTGAQTIVFSVPASMVPVADYTVFLDNDVIENAGSAGVIRETAYPASLFYEVGLRGDITDETVANLVAEDYAYNDNGVYTFYTNTWAADATGTGVRFVPAAENEFYYFNRDTPIFQQSGGGYTALAGDPDPGTTYYYQSPLYSVTGNSAPSTPIEVQYREIPAEAMASAIASGGTRIIPQGTPKLASYSYELAKENNVTQTYADVRTLTPHDNGGVLNVSVMLGNNGLLHLEEPEARLQPGDGSEPGLWAALLAGMLLAALFGGLALYRTQRQKRKT